MRAIAVLAGGRSSHFGPNKATAMLAGTPLLLHVLDQHTQYTLGTNLVRFPLKHSDQFAEAFSM